MHNPTALDCPTCAYPNYFLTVDSLRAHLVAVHFKNHCLYTCSACRGEYRFPTQGTLSHHLKKDHGIQQHTALFEFSSEERLYMQKLDKLVLIAVKSSMAPASEVELSGDTVNFGHPSKGSLKIEQPDVAIEGEVEASAHAEIDVVGGNGDMMEAAATQFPTPQVGATAEMVMTDDTGLFKVLFPTIQPPPQTHVIHQAPSHSHPPAVGQQYTGRKRKKVECIRCHQLVNNEKSAKLSHANAKHLKLALHKCGACSWTSTAYAPIGITRHITMEHYGQGPKELLAVHMVEDHRRQLEMMAKQLFPTQ